MDYDPEIHHRRSIRMPGYDYAAGGAYFITVCVQGRERLFGDIRGHAMVPNDAGRMVGEWWRELENKFPSVGIDTFVIMPNHFHGVLFLVGASLCGCPVSYGRADSGGCPEPGENSGRPRRAAPTLGDVMDWFKTMTTNAYIRGVKQSDWPPFPGRLWQRNYYERIVRDEAELAVIREYIAANPANWADDEEYAP